MTETEFVAQAAIDRAAALSAREQADRIDRLPRWRRWLIRKITPSYPVTFAQMPSGVVYLTKPLDVGPGVAISGLITEQESTATPDQRSS